MSLSLGPHLPLSYLGLARATGMSGDIAKARKAYQDLFALWKTPIPTSCLSSEPAKNTPRCLKLTAM
jgi:hypothetical protein